MLAQPALPESTVVFYGQVTPAMDLSTVAFSLTGNSETLTTTTPAQIVTVEGQGYFLVRIPFESRVVQGGSPRTPTPGTLALPAADTTYTLTAKVGDQNAVLSTGKSTFVYSAQRQGLMDRIDLSFGGETYEQWSQRIFGSLVSQTDDADGDGRGNYEEFLAGTDPRDPASRWMVKTFEPLPGGGYRISWDSQSGKNYRVERSTSLAPGQWSVLQQDIPGDGSLKSFTGTPPADAPRVFYPIGVAG